MAVVAYVTKLGPGLYSARRAPGSIATVPGTPTAADRRGDIGTATNARAAQKLCENSINSGKPLTWEKERRMEPIEAYIGSNYP